MKNALSPLKIDLMQISFEFLYQKKILNKILIRIDTKKLIKKLGHQIIKNKTINYYNIK